MKNRQNHRQRASYYPLRLAATLLVLLLCSFKPVQSSSVNEIEIIIPVDFYKLPQGLTLVDWAPKEIELRVKGPPAVLDDLKRNAPRYKLDLSGAAVGSESIAVNPDLIQMPAEAQITRVNPAYLTVKVDRLLKKRVAVKVAVSGEPDGSYFISDMLARPSTIIICGPETAVGSVDEIFTKPIDVTGRSESFKKEIAVDLVQGVQPCFSSNIVMAEIYFAAKIVTKRFAGILVQGQNTPYTFDISPGTLKLEIKGPLNIIENLQPQKDIHVFVELKNLKPGVYVRRATISLPVKTTLVNVEPELFTVKISDQNTGLRTKD
jgi:YbbR domain-containing protein